METNITAMTNPMAPVVNNGVDQTAPQGWQDQSFDYVYDVSLTANEYLPDQIVPIYTYAEFIMRAMIITVQTGLFSVRFADGQGYYLSNVLIDSYNLVGTPSDPFIFFPEVPYPAGGRIGIDIQEGSGLPNVIQIVFRGVNRYRLNGRT
jgi:hypothetical protein